MTASRVEQIQTDVRITHPRTRDGRARHYFSRTHGLHRCACGETRTTTGRVVTPGNYELEEVVGR